MNSLRFPNMFSGVTTYTVTDHEATAQNLKLMILSDRGSLFGDPYFGTLWKRLMFNQNDVILKDIIIDDLLTSIQTFMPQILVNREDITVESSRATVYITIKGMNLLDYQLDTYSIKLMGDEIE